jgi:hypothetical protein
MILSDFVPTGFSDDEVDELYRIAVAAQAVGTLPSDYTISLLTDGYGHDESEQRHCLAAARVALARWGRSVPAPKPIPVCERLPEDADCLVIPPLGASTFPLRYCWQAREIIHCGQARLIWDWKLVPLTTAENWPFTYWLPASTQFLPTTVDGDADVGNTMEKC